DLLDGQGTDPRCRELDRERNSIQAATDRYYMGRGQTVEGKARLIQPGSLHEEADCFELPDRPSLSFGAWRRQRETGDAVALLTGNSERLAAAGEDLQVRTTPEEAVRQRCGGRQQ